MARGSAKLLFLDRGGARLRDLVDRLGMRVDRFCVGIRHIAAARALCAHSALEAPQIAEHALRIAAGICVYTNDRISVEVLA